MLNSELPYFDIYLVNIFLAVLFLVHLLPGEHSIGPVLQLAKQVVARDLVNAVLGARLRNGLVPAQRHQGNLTWNVATWFLRFATLFVVLIGVCAANTTARILGSTAVVFRSQRWYVEMPKV